MVPICSQLHKSLESGNGAKISDEKWHSVKSKYLKQKLIKGYQDTVKTTRMSSNCNGVSCFWQISGSKITGGKIQGVKLEKLQKMMEISMFFINFWLDQVQSCSVQIKKMKDRIFSFT